MIVGVVSGSIAGVAAIAVLLFSGAAASLSSATGLRAPTIAGLFALLMALAGALYGRVFMRAANDTRGGWLFGISYGFGLWMIGPVTVMQWFLARPVAVGHSAQGLFASHLAWGLALGILFPHIHRVVQRKSTSEAEKAAGLV